MVRAARSSASAGPSTSRSDVGGYFDSRLLLTLINGIGFFVIMVVVGVPVDLALPLAVFGGFVSEFIPNVGTYIGAAVPVLSTLAVSWPRAGARRRRLCVVYQQIENYWLSPRISAKTMELNGGSPSAPPSPAARCSAPWGPSWRCRSRRSLSRSISNYRHPHEVVYQSQYADAAEQAARGGCRGGRTRGADGAGAVE